MSDLRIKSGFTPRRRRGGFPPRISIGPAGCRINRDYARRGWATETGHPNWGPRDPGLERADKYCIESQTTRAEWGAACKGVGEGRNTVTVEGA